MRALQLTEKTDHSGADLGGPLLLGPVTAARQHDGVAQMRHVILQIRDQPIHTGKGDYQIAIAGQDRGFDIDETGPDARLLGTFSNGRPFLIERPYGRGRVLMLTTSLDNGWTSLPLSNFYLPFVQSLARYAAENASALVEIDVNPVIVRPAGLGAVAVDTMIRLQQIP